MKLKKRILKHPLTLAVLAWLLSLYIRFVSATSRKTFDFHEEAKPYFRGEGNCIFAFWHGRIMMCPIVCPPEIPMRVLISHHGDGQLISRVIGHFGPETISGSSSRGARAATMEMLRSLRRGDNVAITPDGPRGPSQMAAMGVAAIARISGQAIVPLTFSSTRHKRTRSWDRFMVALPFGHIVFGAGAPMMVEKDAPEEDARQKIEDAMNQLTGRIDALAGL